MNKKEDSFDKAKAEEILNRLLNYYNIEVSEISKRFNEGYSTYDFNGNYDIIIPEINCEVSFGTALHEIGHIINKWLTPYVYDEFMAEMFALDTARYYGFSMNEYERHVNGYITITLLKYLNNNSKNCYDKLPANLKIYIEKNIYKNICFLENKRLFYQYTDGYYSLCINTFPKIYKIKKTLNITNSIKDFFITNSDIVNLLLSNNLSIRNLYNYEQLYLYALNYNPNLSIDRQTIELNF